MPRYIGPEEELIAEVETFLGCRPWWKRVLDMSIGDVWDRLLMRHRKEQ